MLICAKAVLTMEGGPLLPGCVRVEGNVVKDVGEKLEPLEGEEVIELPGHVLLPGLINAHCHLDYTGFKGAIFPGKSFTEWMLRMNRLKNSFDQKDYAQAIARGFEMLQQSGCTTVFNIAAFPDLLIKMPPPPIRTWWFLELVDLRHRFQDDESIFGAMEFFGTRSGWLGGVGISPHAPYTASIELYRSAKRCAEHFRIPYMTHIAESADEDEMFRRAQGPLYEFLDEIERDMRDCGRTSPLLHLLENHALPQQTIATHMNYLEEEDFAALLENPLSVAHCPKCHAYFGHARFALEKLRECGCNICLGTDSLASNDSLDLRAEIREARKSYPKISAREWLEMVTTNPARAIGLEGKLGCIRPGALADLVAFRLADQAAGPFEAVIASTTRPDFLMINGKKLP